MRTENSSLSDWLSALAKVTGKAPRRSGDEYRSPCPAHGGNGFNLAIVERSGKILTTCHSHGCRHEDIREAIGLDQPARVNGSRSGPVPTHRNATREPEDRRWTYFNEHGDRHLDVVRTEGPEGKRIRRDPAGVEGPHPLYNLRELLECPDDPVLVVEGEKAADAAVELFRGYVVVTSSLGGARAGEGFELDAAHRDRNVVDLARCSDEPGRKVRWRWSGISPARPGRSRCASSRCPERVPGWVGRGRPGAGGSRSPGAAGTPSDAASEAA